ncbi:hypothetical protein ABZP36_008388 [Zizania latifolia]
MMSLSSYLTCNLVPRRAAAADPYDPQPQTATCCTALHRADGRLAQPRYAPLRTPESMLLHPAADPPPSSTTAGQGQQLHEEATCTPKQQATSSSSKKKKKMVVRKCKSTVEDVDVSPQLLIEIEGPRLRRSGGVRRDWSFEDLRANNAAA